MYKITYILSKYLLILNVISLFILMMIGPVELLWIFIASICTLTITMKIMKRAIRLDRDRVRLMHNTGDNDFDLEVGE